MSPQVPRKYKCQHLFSLLVFTGCSSGSNSRLGWASGLLWCLLILSWMTSVTWGSLKSVCRVIFFYVPGCICYGSENFGLGSVHDEYVELAGATSVFWAINLFFYPEKGRRYISPRKFSSISQKKYGVMTRTTIIFTRYRQITSNLANVYNEIKSLWGPRCCAHCLSHPPVFWLVGSFPTATVASHSFHCCITVSCSVSGDLL